MTEEQKKEEIIKAWFAIDEWSDDVCTKLFSYKYPERKIYVAEIRFDFETFVSQDTDRYKAMEKAIMYYSEFITKNEIK